MKNKILGIENLVIDEKIIELENILINNKNKRNNNRNRDLQ